LPSINGLKREDCEALLEELEGKGTIISSKKGRSAEKRPRNQKKRREKNKL
jgi:hypothetical protein